MRHFLSIADFSAAELWQLLSKAKELKDEFKQKGSNQPLLKRYGFITRQMNERMAKLIYSPFAHSQILEGEA
jgi:ornithine carbamoyltransferase